MAQDQGQDVAPVNGTLATDAKSDDLHRESCFSAEIGVWAVPRKLAVVPCRAGQSSIVDSVARFPASYSSVPIGPFWTTQVPCGLHRE
jgi:hypothetical protein